MYVQYFKSVTALTHSPTFFFPFFLWFLLLWETHNFPMRNFECVCVLSHRFWSICLPKWAKTALSTAFGKHSSLIYSVCGEQCGVVHASLLRLMCYPKLGSEYDTCSTIISILFLVFILWHYFLLLFTFLLVIYVMVHQTVAKRKYLAQIIIIVIIAKKRAERLHFISFCLCSTTMPFKCYAFWYCWMWVQQQLNTK